MRQPIDSFEILDSNPEYEVRDLGKLTYKGVTMDVELHAFVEDDDDPFSYDYDAADVILLRQDDIPDDAWTEILKEFGMKGGILAILQTYLNLILEGESRVQWGESGAQSDEGLAFGRNGW